MDRIVWLRVVNHVWILRNQAFFCRELSADLRWDLLHFLWRQRIAAVRMIVRRCVLCGHQHGREKEPSEAQDDPRLGGSPKNSAIAHGKRRLPSALLAAHPLGSTALCRLSSRAWQHKACCSRYWHSRRGS